MPDRKPLWPFTRPILDQRGRAVKPIAHANGQWAIKRMGRLWYLGVVADPDAARARLIAWLPAIEQGMDPRTSPDAVETVMGLYQAFLDDFSDRVQAGERAPSTLHKYDQHGKVIIDGLGPDRRVHTLGPPDFARLRRFMANRWGVYRLADGIRTVKHVLSWGYDMGYLKAPVRYGGRFDPPTAKAVRSRIAAKRRRLPQPWTVVRAILAAEPVLRPVLLLGINCGMTRADIEDLSPSDIRGSDIDRERVKTQVHQFAPMWPCTLWTINQVRHDAGPILRTQRGKPWTETSLKRYMDRLRQTPGLEDFQQSMLRACFQTAADRFPRGASLVMGHVEDRGVKAHYSFSDVRDDARRAASAASTWLWAWRR